MSDSLFAAFPDRSKQEWLDKVEKDLRGKALESLNWQVREDWTISPFAHSEDWTEKVPPIVSSGKTTNSWEIGERIVVKEAKVANEIALSALENGVNALLLILPNTFSTEDFEMLLKGIELEWISVHFDATSDANLPSFLSFLTQSACDFSKLKGSWRTEETTLAFYEALPNFKFYQVKGVPYYQNTKNTIQELTQITRALHEQLQQIEAYQIQQVHLSIAVGESYFISIAKIRALKLLWQNLLSAYGLAIDLPLHIEAHLAPASFTDDQHQNMAKAATQALSAVIGGVDRLFIAPADGRENPFTKRIARNIQHLLQLESHLDHVLDPAAGSYYIEQLTQEIGVRVWEQFKLDG
ncbi:MAG: methylmalonyl-CoA mutase family protein [Bacteroidota bacterium]